MISMTVTVDSVQRRSSPPSMVLEFLIGYQALPGAAHGESAHRMVERTLTAMARGWHV